MGRVCTPCLSVSPGIYAQTKQGKSENEEEKKFYRIGYGVNPIKEI